MMSSEERSGHLQEQERNPLIQQCNFRENSVCNIVLRKHHQQFRRYLNVHVIVPLLNRHGLLSALDPTVFADPRFNVENKVDILLDGLYKCQQENYISILIQCLRQSAEEAGEAHSDLADDIEDHYHKELRRHSSSKSHVRRLLAILFIAIIIAFVSMIFIYVGIAYNATSGFKTFPVTGSGTIPLDFLLKHMKWLNNIQISFQTKGKGHNDNIDGFPCSGEATVIEGEECHNLSQVTENKNVTDLLNTCFILAHPGSEFNVTLPDRLDPLKDYHVWITRNLIEYDKLNSQLHQSRDNPFPSGPLSMICDDYKESCFPIKNYNASGVIPYKVQSTNFYCYTLTDSQDYRPKGSFQDSIQFSYKLVTYNFTIIAKNKSLKKVPVESGESSTLHINTLFEFHGKTCPLMYFDCKSCPRGSSTPDCFQIVIKRKPRMDYLILMVLGSLTLICTIFVVLLVFCLYHKYRKSHS